MTDFTYQRRPTRLIELQGHKLGCGEEDRAPQPPRVVASREHWAELAPQFAQLGDTRPEIIAEKLRDENELIELDPASENFAEKIAELSKKPVEKIVALADLPEGCDAAEIRRKNSPTELIAAHRQLADALPAEQPILLKDTLSPAVAESLGDIEIEQAIAPLLTASTVFGALLCDGIGDAVWLRSHPTPFAANRLCYNILQATGTRIFKTDYVACPSCGRTLFNLQETTQTIRAATGHLKGVRIAIMGCIVNGPGEMADADFGYVGGAPGKINLYVGKTAVEFNIPQAEAVDRLIELIRSHERWVDAV